MKVVKHSLIRKRNVHVLYGQLKEFPYAVKLNPEQFMMKVIAIFLWIHSEAANQKTNYVASVRERTIPTERTPVVGQVSANV
jgi:hypothetical protein